jgi:Ca2+-binding EF-hand superfamily protein
MYDKDNNFRLDENEFPLLWNDIYTWLKAFRQYDANNSGSIDSIELRLLLDDMGM